MVTFDCTARHHGGVTLVTASLGDIETPTRVTVRNRLDGPVWPPRSEGLPEAGWTENGFSGVVAPGTQTLGYATPAQPTEQPAELTDAVPMPEADPVGSSTDSPADVVRELGDPSPPGDAVPVGEDRDPSTTASSSQTSDSVPVGEDRDPSTTASSSQTDAADPIGSPPVGRESRSLSESADGTRLPAAVEPWLAEMEQRVEQAEALAAAETVPEATTAVRETGGLGEVRTLAEAVDERRLRLVAQRARRLADRRAGARIPVETLSTLS